MPNNIEKKTQYEWKFARQLNESRRRIDLNSPVGKALDKLVYPLYKKYGFYDSARLLVDMDLTQVSNKELAAFNEPEQKLMQQIGIDVEYYNNLSNLSVQDSSNLSTAYVRATGSLRDVRRNFNHRHSSGNYAWNTYGLLYWVVEFNNMLEKIKNEQYESIKGKKKEITENLQKLIYHSPKKTDRHIEEVANNFNTHRYYVIESFKEIIGHTPKEYTELLVNEALGDYAKFKGGQLKNKLVGKFGLGQAKTIAKAKVKAGEEMNSVLTRWNQTTLGNPKAATPQALRGFLINTLKVNPAVITAVMKKYKNKLIKENISLKEDYLPQGSLRGFFLDIINAQRAEALKTPRKVVAKNVAPSPAAAVPLSNKPFVQPAGVTQTAPQGPNVQTMQTTPNVQPTQKPASSVGDVENALKSLPGNLRAQAILQALPSLSDDQIKQVLNSLIGKK